MNTKENEDKVTLTKIILKEEEKTRCDQRFSKVTFRLS